MQLLKDRIRKDGKIKGGNVLKVDSFLNHQMDIKLFEEIGKEFKRRFAHRPATGMSLHGGETGACSFFHFHLALFLLCT